MVKIVADKRLFWFLKEGMRLNLSEPSVLDMYFQQVISRGRTEDIRVLLRTLKLKEIQDALIRIKRFIPVEVRKFWEDLIADNK